MGMSHPVSWASPLPNLFALIIGINRYNPSEGFLRLHSAVRDAYGYKDYLTARLEVPENQIRVLTNEQASRAAILEAFMSIKDDPRIKDGDPIFISMRVMDPKLNHLRAGNQVDYCSVIGLEIPGIPDRTIGALLEDIAEKKGNNISVVLDCCYSASGTRGPNNKLAGRPRSVVLKPTIHTKDLDREIWDKGAKLPHPVPKFRFSGLRSHILIAACGSSELAVEFSRHGSFSTAFLNLLRTVPPDQLRYSEILTRMDRISGQNPQIEGVNQDRYLFNAKSHSPSFLGYPLRHDEDLRLIFIDAGVAHGITVGTEFASIQRPDSDVGMALGTLIVEQANTFSSIFKFDDQWWTFLTNTNTTVVQKRAGKREDLRLYVSPGANYRVSCEHLLSLLQNPDYDLHNVALIDDRGSAHLEITIDRNEAIVRLIDKRVTQQGLHFRFPTIDAHGSKMAPFLRSASQYFWELDRTGDDVGLMKDVEVSFYELDESRSPFEEVKRPEMSPVGCNLNQDNQVDIVAKEERFYGVKLTNNSPYDLYPTLLYFDNTDLTDITTYYKPNSSGHYLPDPPLKADGGTLTVGYGSGGMPPLSYSLPEGQDLTVGFLKLFIFNQPLDSPTRFHPSSHTETRSEKWDTLLIPIIQRRYRIRTPPVRLANVWPDTKAHIYPMGRRTTSLPDSLGARHGQGRYGYPNLVR